MRANINELLLLIADINPAVICLQEIFLKSDNKTNLKEYQHFTYIKDSNLRASGGTSILVRNNVPHSHINLKTDLQAIAVRITLHKQIDICSIYIPPNAEINKDKLQEIIGQLSAPYPLLGDFNSHNTIWGCKKTNRRGKDIESFIDNNNLCLYNNKSPTYICPFSGSCTAIDLSLCDPPSSWILIGRFTMILAEATTSP